MLNACTPVYATLEDTLVSSAIDALTGPIDAVLAVLGAAPAWMLDQATRLSTSLLGSGI